MRKYLKFFVFLFCKSLRSKKLIEHGYCYTSQLEKPAHAKGWKCNGPSNVKVERSVKSTVGGESVVIIDC